MTLRWMTEGRRPRSELLLVGATRSFRSGQAGPRIEAVLGYFHERHHVVYERLMEICRDVFGLAISEGGIDLAIRRLAERARPTCDGLGTEVRAGPVIGSDETGARVAGRTAWHSEASDRPGGFGRDLDSSANRRY